MTRKHRDFASDLPIVGPVGSAFGALEGVVVSIDALQPIVVVDTAFQSAEQSAFVAEGASGPRAHSGVLLAP